MPDEQTPEEKQRTGIVGDDGEVTVPVEVTVTETRELPRAPRRFDNPYGPQLSADADAPPSPDEIQRETDIPEGPTREDPEAANAALNELRRLTPTSVPSRFSPPLTPTQRVIEKVGDAARTLRDALPGGSGKPTG